MVLAATVKIHGATLIADPGSGPLLPADCTVRIPLAIAWKAPIEIVSFSYVEGSSPPIEMLMMSTPSAMASSNADSTDAGVHSVSVHTL
ncbi:hypothetical protein CARUB_v10027452mg [Capsella rubella]|uniref:Uncharacterized protein n=1 Tax=Capsella rubella TaxID=81985 RepID=R0G7X5_9BRAS|nr:hypothetical protein CARUB_v10027452mg [Capsella rubella]